MNYRKLGQIFKPEGLHDWMHYYAAPVTALEFDDCIRVYFTTRSKLDAAGHFRAYIAFVDCDKHDPRRVLRIAEAPLLVCGPPGTFDEHGTMVADVIRHEGRIYMYYMGWQRSATVPYKNMLGLAVSEDGIHFSKVSEGPVIGIGRHLPLGIGNVSVLVEGGLFRMWYTHYRPWIPTSGQGFRPNYDIRYASSTNGLDWDFGPQCIAPDENEALATPCVRRLGGKYQMWYSYRPGVDRSGKSGLYRIGHAVSDDGLHWARHDAELPLLVSEAGWDAEMICYPDVLETAAGCYLFYCGNGYGRDGFGCARLEA